MRALPTTWREPPWGAALDANAYLEAIPASATIHGLFPAAVAAAARKKGVALPSGRASYVPFRPYPLREHAVLLLEAARACWPEEPLRQGLRHLGRGAPQALVQSMLGRIVLGSVEGPLELLRAMATSYGHHLNHGALEVQELARGSAVVRAREVFTFLDAHHVGVFEGVLKYAGVQERSVRIHSWSATEADLLCEWSGTG